MATVYLIHFEQAYKHAKHYLGIAEDLDARLEAHASGHGARLMSVIQSAGITWRCVRTWQGSRKLERQLKNRKHAALLCPVCAGDKALNRARKENRWRIIPNKSNARRMLAFLNALCGSCRRTSTGSRRRRLHQQYPQTGSDTNSTFVC